LLQNPDGSLASAPIPLDTFEARGAQELARSDLAQASLAPDLVRGRFDHAARPEALDGTQHGLASLLGLPCDAPLP